MQKKIDIAKIIKNAAMALLSLLIIVMNVACYLSIKGVFQGGNEFNGLYNGLYLWELVFTQPDYFAQSFHIDALWAIVEFIPLLLFTFAAINLIVFVIGAIARRYNAAFGVIASVFICALCVALLFLPYINIVKGAHFTGAESVMTVSEYFKYIVNPQYTTIFIAPAVGAVQFVASIAFCFRFGKNEAKEEN